MNKRIDDLHILPKIRDSLSYLYVEHSRIDRHEQSIAVWDAHGGHSAVPVAALSVLMLGPGTAVTHAAVQTMADNSCLVVWCGEENVRFYAFGTGGTRSAAPLLLQARLFSNEQTRLEVVKRMYRMRFDEWPGDGGPGDAENLTIEQMRGMEGARMRATYAEASRTTGVAWDGRNYDRTDWGASSPVNRALSAANACLYGLCHAALLATGYSPGIGFIHTGKQLSFVYDIADLYKADISIPVAFSVAADAAIDPDLNVDRAARLLCRDRFRETKLLGRIVPDIQRLFGGKDHPTSDQLPNDPDTGDPAPLDFDTADRALPGALWAPQSEGGTVRGGIAYGTNADDTDSHAAARAPRDESIALPSPAPSIEDLFLRPDAPEKTPTVPKVSAAPTFPDGPFTPDPGCETPPWGDGSDPWERLHRAVEKAEAAAKSGTPKAPNARNTKPETGAP